MLETYRSASALQSTPSLGLSRSVDLLWRDATSGAAQIWAMQGANLVGSASFETISPSWQVMATTDVDTNGRAEIFWRNTVTGENVRWVTQNQQRIADQWLLTIGDQNWEIVGAGDLNRDSQTDLLWRNKVSGENVWWYLRDGQLIGSTWLMTIHPSWSIVTVGDFNHDREIDILWRNQTSGETLWWLMQGTNIVQTVTLPQVDPAITLVESADFNQDGQLDLLWRDPRNGANRIWLMEGTQVLERYDLPSVASSWILSGLLPRLAASLPDGGTSLATATAQASARFFQTQQVSADRPQDFYSFTIGQSGIFTGYLTGLTGDADLKLIQDRNSNGTIDAGEILAWQWERGSGSESIRRFLTPGTYYVQVTNYTPQTVNYSLSTNFTPASVDDQQFRLNVDYGVGTSLLTDTARVAIADAARYWESIIPRRSAITQFQNLTVTIRVEEIQNFNVLAAAGPNPISDGQSLFIQSGTATLNTLRLSELNTNRAYLTSIMIHEFAHALGFGLLWEPIDFAAGSTILSIGQRLLDRSNNTYRTNSYVGWAYGTLLGTNVPTAVPLDAASLSHWDETRFDTELMTPYAEAIGVATPTSQLTIAALRDLGWYVNYGAADFYTLPSAPQLPNPSLTVAFTTEPSAGESISAPWSTEPESSPESESSLNDPLMMTDDISTVEAGGEILENDFDNAVAIVSEGEMPFEEPPAQILEPFSATSPETESEPLIEPSIALPKLPFQPQTDLAPEPDPWFAIDPNPMLVIAPSNNLPIELRLEIIPA